MKQVSLIDIKYTFTAIIMHNFIQLIGGEQDPVL